MNKKGSGRNDHGLVLRHVLSICIEGLRKTMKRQGSR